MTRFCWRRFVLPFLFVLGCGERRDAAAGADAGPATVSGESDAAIEPPVLPPAGGCGVVRRIALLLDGDVVRAPGGFGVVGSARELAAWPSVRVMWRAISEDGRRQVARAGTATGEVSLAVLPMGRDPFAGRLLHVVRSARAIDRIDAESIADGSTGMPHEIGETFFRGTLMKASAVSLDGARAVYVSGHVVVQNPRAFMLDEHAKLVAGAFELSESEDQSFTCLAVLPTAHGALVSFVEDAQPSFLLRMVEIGPDGNKVQDVSVELATRSCPAIQLARDGFWITIPGVGQTFDLWQVRGGEVRVRETGLELPSQLLPSWIGETERGERLYLLANQDGLRQLVRKDAGNHWQVVGGDRLDVGEVIAAEPGRLFAIRGFNPERELVEIACDQLAPLRPD